MRASGELRGEDEHEGRIFHNFPIRTYGLRVYRRSLYPAIILSLKPMREFVWTAVQTHPVTKL